MACRALASDWMGPTERASMRDVALLSLRPEKGGRKIRGGVDAAAISCCRASRRPQLRGCDSWEQYGDAAVDPSPQEQKTPGIASKHVYSRKMHRRAFARSDAVAERPFGAGRGRRRPIWTALRVDGCRRSAAGYRAGISYERCAPLLKFEVLSLDMYRGATRGETRYRSTDLKKINGSRHSV